MRRIAAAVAVLSLALAACSGDEPATARVEGVAVAQEDPSHEHTTKRQEYDRQPPWGGPHWPPSEGGVRGWLTCGVYDAPVPAEFAVHSLEHGAVWLTHLPDAAPAVREALRDLAALRPEYVLVSPYPGQPAPVVATAWGAQLAAQSASDERLRAFVESYAGGDQGGEPGAPCTDGATPQQAADALARAGG